MAEEKKSPISVYIFFVCMALFCAAYSLYAQNNRMVLDKNLAQEAQEQERLALQKKEFDDIIDLMERDLSSARNVYDANRKKLDRILDPANFSSADKTRQTYKTFTGKIVPDLKQDASDIMQIFILNKSKINQNFKDQNGQLKAEFSQKWASVEKNQISFYIDFFKREQEIMTAYKSLIEFYIQKTGVYKIDLKSGKTVFKFQSDAEIEQELKAQISDFNAR